MKKLIYTEGPDIMTCGVAGEFRIGVPREVSDDLAAILLRKGRLKEFTEASPENTGRAAAAPKKRAAETKEE